MIGETAAKIVRKEGVQGEPSKPLLYAIGQAAVIYGWFGQAEMVITALRDGVHKVHSLHPRGYAVDIRTNGIASGIVRAIVATLKRMLPGFDVILEGADTPGATAAHIHIEFDPEGNAGLNLPVAA